MVSVCLCLDFRQCSHHSAQPSEGEGGEGHAPEDGPAAEQQRDAAAGTQRTAPSHTHQQRGRKGHPAAPGEDPEEQVEERGGQELIEELIELKDTQGG